MQDQHPSSGVSMYNCCRKTCSSVFHSTFLDANLLKLCPFYPTFFGKSSTQKSFQGGICDRSEEGAVDANDDQPEIFCYRKNSNHSQHFQPKSYMSHDWGCFSTGLFTIFRPPFVRPKFLAIRRLPFHLWHHGSYSSDVDARVTLFPPPTERPLRSLHFLQGKLELAHKKWCQHTVPPVITGVFIHIHHEQCSSSTRKIHSFGNIYVWATKINFPNPMNIFVRIPIPVPLACQRVCHGIFTSSCEQLWTYPSWTKRAVSKWYKALVLKTETCVSKLKRLSCSKQQT